MILKLLSPTSLKAAVLLTLLTVPVLAGPIEKGSSTETPIQYVVVLFQENVSFDHYFGTYPAAANPKGQPPFRAAENTPTVNGLNGALLSRNPNSAQPFRLDRSQPVTCATPCSGHRRRAR